MNWDEFIALPEKVEKLNDIKGLLIKPLTTEIELNEMFWERLMEYTLYDDHCMGMAGPQLGMPYSGFYLAAMPFGEWRFRNPVIEQLSVDTQIYKKEGCVSLPGVYKDTIRHNWIDIYDDINGSNRYTGILAVCIQHEMDHLAGTTFLDHLAPADYKKKKTGRNDPCPECIAEGRINPPKFKRCLLHFQ